MFETDSEGAAGRSVGPPRPPFAHLVVRSCYSLRDGAIRPGELAAAAAAAGMSHVALTDRDGVYGAVRFVQACAAHDVTPVLGADLALEGDQSRPGWELTRAGRTRLPPRSSGGARSQRGDLAAPSPGDLAAPSPGDPAAPSPGDPRRRRPAAGPAYLEDDAPRVVLLARTRDGYGDLCRTVTAAHGTRLDPHLAFHDAPLAARGGCWALLGRDSPVGRLVAAGRLAAAEAEMRRWLEVFGRGALLLGVRHHLEQPDDRIAAHTLALADRLGVTPVAVNDVRYLTRDDVVLADVLACVRAQAPLSRRYVGRTTAEGWFKTAGDLLPLFRERPDLLANAQAVAESCEVDLGLGTLHVPRLTGLPPDAAAGELRRRAWTGLAERVDRVTPQVRERLEAEFQMVDRLGLHDYFLAVADVVAEVRAAGILCACRGSAAGSLICYALRISDVDPVANGLCFERFMNPYRDELPDIDIDVESARREDVYRMVMDRYGQDRVACVAMVETFQARMAIREVGKAMDLPADEIDAVAKAFPRLRARDVRRAAASLPELAGRNFDTGRLDVLLDVVERIDGFPRHMALHPCGILLADTHLLDRTPLQASAAGFRMAQFDKDDVAALGLLKLDVLGVRMLSAVRHTLDLVADTRGRSLEVADLPRGDPATYALMRSTRSVGMFQLESPGQQELLGRLQPEDFGDVITEISLFRPGPVKADMVSPFVARRRGQEPPDYTHPALRPVLAETFGVIVYHEQVMGAVAALTGCDLAYADLVRRQLGDDDQAANLRGWALHHAAERGFDAAVAAEIWRQVISFASFGFCKAHAAAFAVITERSAYLKAHYLPEFVAGLLTHDPGMYPRRMLLEEARAFGVAVLRPDVNHSQAAYTVEQVDEAEADRLLGLTGQRLPPGWRPGGGDGARPVPPGGRDAGAAGADDARRWAVRVGLADVRGITDAELDALLAARPFASLADLRRRGGLSRPTAEALCLAGALDGLAGVGAGGGEAKTTRREVLLAVEEAWSGVRRRRSEPATARPDQQRLALHVGHDPQLPAPTDAETVRDELAVLGLDVSRHVLSFYDPLLEHLGVVRASDLLDVPDGRRVRVAGVKVAVQSPPVRTGQRVMFVTLDDATGTVQATYFERTLDACAWTLRHGWLLVCEGRARRRGVRGVTVNGMRVWDLTRLWRGFRRGRLEAALAERGGGPPASRRPSPAGLAAAEFGRGAPRT